MRRLLRHPFYPLVPSIFLVLLCACSESGKTDDPPTPDKPFLTLRTPLTVFDAEGSRAEFVFSTNQAWSIDRDLQDGDAGEWFTPEPLAGKAGENISVSVTVEPNEAYVPRSGTLVLRTEPDEAGTVLEERIAVEQRKKNVILLGANRREVGTERQTLQVEVQSNVEYTVAIAEGGDWIGELPESRAAEGLEQKIHRFDIAANTDAQERTGVIVFTAADSELSDELTVVQAAWADPDPEQTALKALYDAAGGSGWTRSDNWCSDKPLGEWYGVETNIEGHVTSLRLPRNNLCGTISEKIASLTHLQHIDLSWNALEGDLTYKMGGNDIRSYFDELLSLESIDLSHNCLTGEFMPGNWYKMQGLNTVNLSSNLLQGFAFPLLWEKMFENGRYVDLILNNNYLHDNVPTVIQNHPHWGRIALQVMRQSTAKGGTGISYDKPVHLPDFTFTDLRDGSQRTIREVYSANTLTMLLAWDPTQEDSKTFAETIVRRFHTLFREQGFGVVAILPDGEEYRQAAEQYLTTHEVPWPVVSEYADAAGERLILPSWPYPSYLLVDQTGKVTHDMFDGQRAVYVKGEPRTMDMLSFRQSDWLGGLFLQILGKSEYQSTDFSKDKQYETLQTATRGKGIDIVLVGEAFTDIDIETGFYRQVMDYAMESFFALEPTKSYREYFNVHCVYAVSKKSYLSENRSTSALQTATSSWRDGHIDPYYPIINEYLAVCPPMSYLNRFPSIIINGYTSGITFLNSTSPNYAFLGYYPGSRDYTKLVLLHEGVGHGVGCLADEYDNALAGNYQITESEKKRLRDRQARNWCLNVSLTDDPQLVPWSHLIGHERYPQVGIFEGGNYFIKGVWRSEPESIMREHRMHVYFNAFCRELIVRRIMELSGEEFSFEKFLANDKDDRNAEISRINEYMDRAKTGYEHMPPIYEN